MVLTHCMDVLIAVEVELAAMREGIGELFELTCNIAWRFCVLCTDDGGITELNKLLACVGTVFALCPAIVGLAEFVPANMAFSIAFEVIDIPVLVGCLGVITEDVCDVRQFVDDGV